MYDDPRMTSHHACDKPQMFRLHVELSRIEIAFASYYMPKRSYTLSPTPHYPLSTVAILVGGRGSQHRQQTNTRHACCRRGHH